MSRCESGSAKSDSALGRVDLVDLGDFALARCRDDAPNCKSRPYRPSCERSSLPKSPTSPKSTRSAFSSEGAMP